MTDEQQTSSEDRINAAMEALNETEEDRWETQQEEQQETQETTETQQQEEKESKSEYYARLIEKDREIRELKAKLKGGSDNLEELAKTNPMAVLEKLGIGLDQILEAWAGSEPTQQEPEPNEELQSIKSELEQFKQAQAKAQYETNYKNEISRINSVVSKDPEKWEIINALKEQGTLELVLETAAEFFKAQGEVPDLTDVLDSVEQHLEEQYLQHYETMQKFNKIKGRLNITQEATKPSEPKPVITKPVSTTLSNSMTSDTQLPGTPTEEERVKRAIALLDQMGD